MIKTRRGFTILHLEAADEESVSIRDRSSRRCSMIRDTFSVDGFQATGRDSVLFYGFIQKNAQS